ncbi:MAG: trigger factor [bacterium]
MTKINVKINKLPNSIVEIEGELGAEAFELYFDKALNKIGAQVEVDGFRKGKVPQNILLSKVPEIRILEEMAEMALEEHYPQIIDNEKLDVIARPEIGITKLARNNPLGFKIKTTLMPELKLGDYKETAKSILTKVTDKEKNVEVTEKELEDTIMDIRKSRAPKKHIAEVAKEKGHVHDENCKHETSPQPSPKGREEESPLPSEEEQGGGELPEFNDDFVRSLGPFKDVEDFNTKLKENIKLEKENKLRETTRLKIIEKIIDETKIDLPEVLINVELDKILYRMESDITQMGLKFEDYLKHLNKTVEDLRKEFRADGEKKAKLGLILNEISKIEKITADAEQVAKEVAMILEHYKEADPERARLHAENVLTNEAVFQFLENQ